MGCEQSSDLPKKLIHGIITLDVKNRISINGGNGNHIYQNSSQIYQNGIKKKNIKPSKR